MPVCSCSKGVFDTKKVREGTKVSIFQPWLENWQITAGVAWVPTRFWHRNCPLIYLHARWVLTITTQHAKLTGHPLKKILSFFARYTFPSLFKEEKCNCKVDHNFGQKIQAKKHRAAAALLTQLFCGSAAASTSFLCVRQGLASFLSLGAEEKQLIWHCQISNFEAIKIFSGKCSTKAIPEPWRIIFFRK